jgi:hypothetical protein
MGHALPHSPARQGETCAGGGVSSLTPPQALTKTRQNNRRPIDGRLLSKETR